MAEITSKYVVKYSDKNASEAQKTNCKFNSYSLTSVSNILYFRLTNKPLEDEEREWLNDMDQSYKIKDPNGPDKKFSDMFFKNWEAFKPQFIKLYNLLQQDQYGMYFKKECMGSFGKNQACFMKVLELLEDIDAKKLNLVDEVGMAELNKIRKIGMSIFDRENNHIQ